MPTYALKSNATTAAAIIGFVSDNGLVNLVGGGAISVIGSAAGTSTGADAISSYGGHPARGDDAALSNYLQVTAATGIVAAEKYAILWMGHFGANADNSIKHIQTPNVSTYFGTSYNATGGALSGAVHTWGAMIGQALSTAGYSHPNTSVFTMISGRETGGVIRSFLNGVGATMHTGSNEAQNSLIAAGDWKFGGSPAADYAAKFGMQLFMVFKGVSPNELAAYLGSDPYAALFDAVAAPQVVFTGTVSAQTGVVGTAGAALALAGYFSAGTAPYTYSVITGSLPAGLALNASTGVITGTPTSAGTYAATIRATDSTSGTATTANSNSIGWTISLPAATATTLTAGSSGGAVGAASAPFTVGANGAIIGTVTVTPSDGGGGGTFAATIGGGTSVTISAGTPTATFTYTPGSVGAKTISISDTGSLTDATPLTYTATLTSGTLTSSPLKNNTGTLLTSAACEAFVSDSTTGALVVKKTGLTSHASTGVVTFADGAVVPATAYRVVWRMTSGGAEGLETLTAT